MNRRGGGALKKAWESTFKILIWLALFFNTYISEKCLFRKKGEGVVGMGVANAIYKTGGFFLIKVTHAFSHSLDQNTWSRKFCTANAFAIDKKCHKEKCLSFASNHTPNFKYKYSIWFYIELCNKLMLPQNNIIKIKIYMNQYFKKNIVQYYFH